MLLIPESFSLHVRANDIYFAIWNTESIFSPINLTLSCFCCHLCYSVIRFLKHYFLYINSFPSNQQIYVYKNTTGNTKNLLCKVYFYFLYFSKVYFLQLLECTCNFYTLNSFHRLQTLCVHCRWYTILGIRKDKSWNRICDPVVGVSASWQHLLRVARARSMGGCVRASSSL